MELTKKEVVFPEVPHGGTLGLVLHDHQGNEIFPETKNITFASSWEDITEGWRNCVAAYEEDPADFYNAWNYLDLHPAFWKFRYGSADPQPYRKALRKQRMPFRKLRRTTAPAPMPVKERIHVKNLEYEDGIHRCVDIMVVKVNAETRSTEDGEPLETEVWIELGQQSWPQEVNLKDPNTFDAKFHDYLLDCGGPTVEAAILRAAHNVWEVYGNDRRVCDGTYNKMAYVTVVDDEYFKELMLENGDDVETNERVRRASLRLHEILEQATGDGKPRRKKAGR